MRISTNTMFQSGINRITDLQSQQNNLQAQISTGKRIATPSDDPVAAARVLEISDTRKINESYANVRSTARSKLETMESSLTNITNLLVAAQSTLVSAGNGGYSNLERGFVATELKGTLDALVGMANTKDANGNYLYAGFRSDTQPFVQNATGASYVGDNNVQMLKVDAQRQFAVSASGDAVFQANGNDVFATLNNIVNLLNTPITDATTQATFSAGLATAITNMQGSVDNILNVRADVGSKLNELDSLDLAGEDRDIQYAKSLSELQDLDYAEALSNLAKQQTIMEAAQKSFVSTTQLSLFDFI
jgi:flagellar hook-associated protein 3 FlgL